MSGLVFSLELAQQLYRSQEKFPIDFDDAWVWLEFSRKDTAKRSFEKAGFIEGIDFCSSRINVEREVGSSVKEQIKMTCECFKHWGMMAGTDKGRQIRLYFLECEQVAKQQASATQVGSDGLAKSAIAEAEAIVDWFEQSLGIDKTVGDLMKVDMVAKQLPHHKAVFEQAKRLLSAKAPLDSVGLTPTEIGERLESPVNAKTINSVLEALGLQEKGTRQSTKTGKDKHFWQVTEKGKQYGRVYLTTGNNNWSGGQIRWQESVVPLIQEYLTDLQNAQNED